MATKRTKKIFVVKPICDDNFNHIEAICNSKSTASYIKKHAERQSLNIMLCYDPKQKLLQRASASFKSKIRKQLKKDPVLPIKLLDQALKYVPEQYEIVEDLLFLSV